MAFDQAGLSRMGGGTRGSTGGPQIWSYRTNDNIAATVDASGYFDNGATTNTGMRNHMEVGDMIYVYGTADTTPTFGIVFVNAKSAAGVIDVTNTITMGTIDSD